jgi:hypothetical protein
MSLRIEIYISFVFTGGVRRAMATVLYVLALPQMRGGAFDQAFDNKREAGVTANALTG